MYKKFKYTKWVTENKHGGSMDMLRETPPPRSGTGSGTPSTGSADPWWCTGTGTAGPSCMQSPIAVSGASGPHPDQATCMAAGCVSTGGPTPTGSTAPGCPSGTGPWAQYPLLDSYISTSTNFSGNFINPNDVTCQLMFEPGDTPSPMEIIQCCEQVSTGSGCDTSPNSPCAQLHFGNNANNFTNFMSNKACTGTHTFSGVMNNLGGQVNALWMNRPNQNAQWNPNINTQGFSGIITMANDAGFTQPQKGQFKRKMAKVSWANCVAYGPGDCCNTIPENTIDENKGGGCGCSKK